MNTTSLETRHRQRTCLRAGTAATALALATMFSAPASVACSPEPYLGSICVTAAVFCPRGYAEASGQILAISSNSALFSLMGTTYGGDGRTTFGLPDLRGRSAVGIGTGPGLSNINQGQKGGAETVTLTAAQIPSHTHQARAISAPGDTNSPVNNTWSTDLGVASATYHSGTPDADMNNAAIDNTGGGQSHENRSPYIGLRHCIAIQGLYPPRN